MSNTTPNPSFSFSVWRRNVTYALISSLSGVMYAAWERNYVYHRSGLRSGVEAVVVEGWRGRVHGREGRKCGFSGMCGGEMDRRGDGGGVVKLN